jgi:hypothetical protein
VIDVKADEAILDANGKVVDMALLNPLIYATENTMKRRFCG